MAARLIGFTATLVIVLIGLAAIAASEPPGAATGRSTGGPRIGSGISPVAVATLEAGYELAMRRLREKPECSALFATFGSDGMEELSSTYYAPAELKMELRLCPKAHGYTVVNGGATWLCRNFARLQDKRAAVVLLHEGLHHAGLNEWPHQKDGLRPRAIDRMVETACDL